VLVLIAAGGDPGGRIVIVVVTAARNPFGQLRVGDHGGRGSGVARSSFEERRDDLTVDATVGCDLFLRLPLSTQNSIISERYTISF
jgi:hypothetical protein